MPPAWFTRPLKIFLQSLISSPSFLSASTFVSNTNYVASLVSMEILGAVASSVALGQAIGAGRHIVRLVHEIPEIQHEFQELKQDASRTFRSTHTWVLTFLQISLITAMLDDVQNGIGTWGSGPTSSTTGEMLLGRTAQRLEEINNELQRFVEHCAKESTDNTVKAKKRKWIMQSDKLQKLREKAMDAKMNLHFALSSQSRNLVCEQVNALQHQFEMFTIHMSSRRPAEASLLLDSSDASENKETEGPESESELESEHGSAQLTPRDESRSSTHITTTQLRQITPMRRTRCSHLCRCRCHSSQRKSRKANWAIPFLGSLLVDYRPAPGTQQTACNDELCSATTDTVFELRYYSPTWLWEGMMSFGASYHKATGLRVALRPKRILPWHGLVMSMMVYASGNFKEAIKNGSLCLYPDDETEISGSIIEFLLSRNSFDLLEFLLPLWKQLLPGQDFPRIVVSLAEKTLSTRRDLTGETRFLMNLISSSTDEAWSETRLSQAIQQGLDMSLIHRALQDEPWTVNEYSSLEDAPLHLASVRLKDAKEVVELLIAMGADINLRNRIGETPLIIAAKKGQLECIRILSRFKGALEAKDRTGNTALHWAFINDEFDAVQLLLASGAQMATRNLDGNTPLHFLTINHIQDESVIQKTLQLLLKHQGADIESRNYLGRTPVVVAMVNNRLSAVRFLVNEGASLQNIDNEELSMIHFVALFSNLHTLQFLHSLSLSGIDLNHVNIYGDTPWDVFQLAIFAPLRYLGSWRRPSIYEQQAFVSLYEGIRNRTAEKDINYLEQVLHALSHQDTTTAFSLLQTLVEEKQKWTSGLDKWYRILARQVQEGELDAVIGSIEDYIEELRELIQSSAWDLPSRFTPRRELAEVQGLESDYESPGEDVDSDGDSDEGEYETAEGEVSSDSGSDEEDEDPQP